MSIFNTAWGHRCDTPTHKNSHVVSKHVKKLLHTKIQNPWGVFGGFSYVTAFLHICIFAFLTAKTILCPLKCDKFAKFFRIWLKFVEFAQIIFTFLGKTLCNIWKFAKKPNMDFWILLCYRFFAFFIQHSHTEKIFWYHH